MTVKTTKVQDRRSALKQCRNVIFLKVPVHCETCHNTLMTRFTSEHILNLISDAYPGLVTYINKNLQYEFTNKEYLTWFGKDPEDIRGKTVKEVIGNQAFLARKPYIDRVLKGEQVMFPTQLVHKRLGLRDLEQIYRPDVAPDGSIQGFISLAYDVTEQKAAEKQAKENELRFRSLTEAIPQLVWVTDPEGKVLWLNENWPKVTGTTMEENLDHGWLNVVHPDDRPYISQRWYGRIANLERGVSEYRLRMADGSYRWHVSRSIPVKNDDGKVLRWVGTTTDIEDQKVAQNIAERERKRIYSLFMQAPIAMVILTGPDLIIDMINSAASKFYSDRLLVGKPMREAMPEIGEQGFVKILQEIYVSGIGRSLHAAEAMLPGPDGKKALHYFDLFYEPIKDESGKTTGVFTISFDVTEQILAAKKVKESEMLFRNYAESMAQMVYISDGTGKITYLNHQWHMYSDEDFSKPDIWSRIVHPEDLPLATQKWRESYVSGKPYEGEFRYLRKDGVYRWHLNRAVQVRDSYGNIIQWVGTVTDIHDQKLFQSELKAKEKKLEEALKARDQFLSIASHELKTPLTSLKLQSQLALKNIRTHKEFSLEKMMAMFLQTNELVDRLTHLIDDMLDVARINTGKLKLNRTKNEISDIIRKVISRMAIMFESAGIPVPEIRVEEKLYGYWDRFRLEQVLGNLLTNAIRYGRGHTVNITIGKKDNEVLLTVTDKGYGISSEDQKRIFGRFERAINSSEVSGLGLGLFISKEIVEAHGGKIWVESELNIGSTFYVSLPLADESGE